MRIHTLALVLALPLSTASCESLYMGSLKTNLVVESVQYGTITRFPPDNVVPLTVVVRTDKRGKNLVAQPKKLRVTGFLRLEDPTTFDPDNVPPPQFDKNGDPVLTGGTVPLRFSLANLVQPVGTNPPYDPVVRSGQTVLRVDVEQLNGQPLIVGSSVTFKTIGYLSNPWPDPGSAPDPNPGDKRLYLTILARRNGKGADYDIRDNFKTIPISLP